MEEDVEIYCAMSGKKKVPYLPNEQRIRPPLKYNPLYVRTHSLIVRFLLRSYTLVL